MPHRVAQKETPCCRLQKNDFSQLSSSPVDHVLFLQRTIGNQAVQRLFKLGVVQAKLKIGQSGVCQSIIYSDNRKIENKKKNRLNKYNY